MLSHHWQSERTNYRAQANVRKMNPHNDNRSTVQMYIVFNRRVVFHYAVVIYHVCNGAVVLQPIKSKNVFWANKNHVSTSTSRVTACELTSNEERERQKEREEEEEVSTRWLIMLWRNLICLIYYIHRREKKTNPEIIIV